MDFLSFWYNRVKVVMFLWVFLDKFNAITGVIAFIFTAINLVFSWKINSKINSAVDLQTLKINKDKELGKINAVIRILSIDDFISEETIREVLLLFSDIRTSYPDLKFLNKKKIIKKLQSKSKRKITSFYIREQLLFLKTKIDRKV